MALAKMKSQSTLTSLSGWVALVRSQSVRRWHLSLIMHNDCTFSTPLIHLQAAAHSPICSSATRLNVSSLCRHHLTLIHPGRCWCAWTPLPPPIPSSIREENHVGRSGCGIKGNRCKGRKARKGLSEEGEGKEVPKGAEELSVPGRLQTRRGPVISRLPDSLLTAP